MLVQQIVREFRAPLFQHALGFGATKLRAVGIGLLSRLLAFNALLKSLQIDHVRQDRLRRNRSASVLRPDQRALARSPAGMTAIRELSVIAVGWSLKKRNHSTTIALL
jgi:hypothetical protein